MHDLPLYSWLPITIILVIGLLYFIRKFVLRWRNLKLNSVQPALRKPKGDLTDLANSEVKVIRKHHALTRDDAAFIESCLFTRKRRG
ncbi:hypothetical protein CGI62_17720 [Vibrio parahaemolyticus]|nr:hypothetical protein CGI62_17720 [Vibrio parahaemolyticus]